MNSANDMSFDLKEIAPDVLDALGAAVTIFDPEGVMLYYNQTAPKILDRRPELIGQRIQECHHEPRSVRMFEGFLDKFKAGRTEDIFYWVKLPGPPRAVRVSPLFKDGKLVACIQTVMKLDSLPK